MNKRLTLGLVVALLATIVINIILLWQVKSGLVQVEAAVYWAEERTAGGHRWLTDSLEKEFDPKSWSGLRHEMDMMLASIERVEEIVRDANTDIRALRIEVGGEGIPPIYPSFRKILEEIQAQR